MLKIRLKRIGKKKQAYFRVVVQEERSKVKGKFLEDLGFWNPHQDIFKVKEERVKYWLSKGAQTTETVRNFLLKQGLISKKNQIREKQGKEKGIEISDYIA